MLPELPDHLRKIGGAKYLGWIISSFSICALLARPFSGLVTDILGRKWAMMGGTAFCIVAGLLYPISQVVWLFFMVRGLHGFSTGFAPTGFAAYTTDIIPSHRHGEALGWQGLFSNMGTSLGYITGSLLVFLFGRSGMYLTSSLLAIGAMYIFSKLPEDKAARQHAGKRSKKIFHWKSWKPALLMMLICIPFGAILTIMPDFTVFSGFSNKGVFLSVSVGFSLLVRIFSGRLSDRLGRPFSTAIGSSLQLISLLMLIFTHGKIWFVISGIFYGTGQGFNAPGLFAWAGDNSSSHTKGRALGMLFIALEIGVIIGSLGGGYLFNGTENGYRNIFIASAGCLATCLLFSIWFIGNHRNNKVNPQ